MLHLKHMQVSRYHRFLRVSAVIAALLVLFESGWISPITRQLSQETQWYLAEVGVGVAARVEPNEINTLSAALRDRQAELDLREARITEREISARSFGNTNESDYTLYILSAILFILTVLICVNYVMDWQRTKRVFTYERKVT